MTEPVVTVWNLNYRYRASSARWVLRNLDLKVGAGEYLLLSGSSGSGKSTLCRVFNGLVPHFYGGVMEGKVQVDGLDTREHTVSELFGLVGFISQNPDAQLFTGTVRRELAFGLESLGLPPEQINNRLEQVATTFGIEELLPRDPHELSGGEQQLVAIAATVALRPSLVVLDEPYASLDPSNVRRVRAALRKVHRQGAAVVVAEHRLQHVAADADRMLVLDQGQVVLDGPPSIVLAEDVTDFGLNPPTVARVGRQIGISPVPLTVPELVSALDGQHLPLDLIPAPRPGQPAGGHPVLQTEDLGYAYGRRRVLADVDLTVRAGECLAVVGANGSGKTTLIKHFNGLHRPARGQVSVMGLDTRRTRTSELARHVGLAFQNANAQFFKFQVQEEIEAGPRALGRYDGAWLQELVALFHLEPLLKRSPYRLSEGEKKRVGFATALAARPEVLVLDEPTTGQDWPFRVALGRLLGNLRSRGQTVVLVTHDLEFAEEHACRWALLAGGRVSVQGDPQQVMGDIRALTKSGLEPTQAFRLRQALGANEP